MRFIGSFESRWLSFTFTKEETILIHDSLRRYADDLENAESVNNQGYTPSQKLANEIQTELHRLNQRRRS